MQRYKRPNQWLHNTIMMMMMMEMTTTIYCQKIWMQIYLKVYQLWWFYSNTKKLHEMLCHIAYSNPLTVDFEIEKDKDYMVANWKIYNRFIQQNKKLVSMPIFQRKRRPCWGKSTEKTMNTNIVVNLASTLMVKLSVIIKLKRTWINF